MWIKLLVTVCDPKSYFFKVLEGFDAVPQIFTELSKWLQSSTCLTSRMTGILQYASTVIAQRYSKMYLEPHVRLLTASGPDFILRTIMWGHSETIYEWFSWGIWFSLDGLAYKVALRQLSMFGMLWEERWHDVLHRIFWDLKSVLLDEWKVLPQSEINLSNTMRVYWMPYHTPYLAVLF